MLTPQPPLSRLCPYRPPFCPRRACVEHRRRDPGYAAAVCGSYRLRTGKRIPRYRCPACKRTFSRNAFSPTYYLKRPELLRGVAAGLVACSAHRQIARSLDCAPSTVTRLSYRIGRHCLLRLLALQASMSETPTEPVNLDHFETFELSQDLPFGVGTAVGADSWFVYALDPAPHGRTGRITPAQRRRMLRRHPRPRLGGYAGSTRRLLDRLIGNNDGARLRLISDDHPSYARTVACHPAANRIVHEIHPNPHRGPKGSPRSEQARLRDRAMFPVDTLHGLIRHSQAAHKRQTIAFGRRLVALLLRLYVLAIWRNLVKKLAEDRSDDRTPAMSLGLTDRRWNWRQAFDRRQFPDRVGLEGLERRIYRMELLNPELPFNTRHNLKLAY